MRRLGLLLWISFVHLAGIYLFTRGFLLTRFSLSEHTTCSNHNCTLPATHKRAVLLIIDALRFDFVTSDPPSPVSQYHHNILTLPRQLTSSQPQHSFLFNGYADPPTSTLQRIKGITTGSLPTFIDIGNNFGGSSILEDSIIKQLRLANKKIAFMGDDTWMSVFPDSFDANMTFPYDSFNVEDLHTVDEGVIRHLFPLLEDPNKPFDFLIGHFLGVDHVGHRVGPDHPSMKAKLTQMNNVLERVVDLLDNDTLLVLLGDHGMDSSGDHGGDGVLETSSALWVYSKGPAISESQASPPPDLLRYSTFPGATKPHRTVQQIDILSTLSLLLGLPIPYNNLGTVIPEFFWGKRDGRDLGHALEINAAQIKKYLDTYRTSPSGGELDDSWPGLEAAWAAAQTTSHSVQTKLSALYNFNREALSECRSIWAQFNPIRMGLGLSVLAIGLLATWCVYQGLSKAKDDWQTWLNVHLARCLTGIVCGVIIGPSVYFLFASSLTGLDALDCTLFFSSLLSSLTAIFSNPPPLTLKALRSTPILLILHSLSFLSNSFTFWEDRIVPFLLVSSIVPYVFVGFTAPVARLRYRIIGFSLLFAVCVRLSAISTVCREEQHPYCYVTFYVSSPLLLPVLALAVLVAVCLPYVLSRFLRITRSDVGLARTFLPTILRSSLLLGALYWILEWAESAGVLGHELAPLLRVFRTWMARLAFGVALLGGGALWWTVPVCLRIEVKDVPFGGGGGTKKQANVIGFANAFGSPYLMFWCISLCAVYTVTQLTGQLVLGLLTVALLAWLEVVDSVRDVRAMENAFLAATPSSLLGLDPARASSPPIQFSDIVPVAVLGIHAFFGTGHQSTVASIQWKSAFLITPSLVYPWAVITVVLNSVGPLFLMALAAPLVALWNRAPLLSNGSVPNVTASSSLIGRKLEDPKARKGAAADPDSQVKGESTLAAVGYMIYFLALLLGAAVSAAILRRHLMVWKVFAPRFMTAVVFVLTTDLALLLGIGLGVERVTSRIGHMFRKTDG